MIAAPPEASEMLVLDLPVPPFCEAIEITMLVINERKPKQGFPRLI
jgi:hypothetical protein